MATGRIGSGPWRNVTNKIIGKRTAAAKRQREVALDGPTGRYWTQWIEPRGAALLSENLRRILFVVKNHGSNNIMLVTEHGGMMDLPPGKVRPTHSYGAVRVENRGEKSVLIEFEFLPIYVK